MIPVFIYQTLKSRRIQEESLGHKAEVKGKATLSGYEEIQVSSGKDSWPTLVRKLGHEVTGEIIIVTGEDLKKLDSWEDHYRRKMVTTSKGDAWVYIYSRPQGEQDAD